MVRAGLGYLAAADAARLPAAAQAEALRELEQADAMATAARASFLAAFTAGAGPAGDGDYSAVSWLIHRTGITRGAAVGAHAPGPSGPPRIRGCSRRWPPGRCRSRSARVICLWTDKLPPEYRDAGDEQLLAAVRRRAWAWRDLAGAVRGDVRPGPRGCARIRTRAGSSRTGR